MKTDKEIPLVAVPHQLRKITNDTGEDFWIRIHDDKDELKRLVETPPDPIPGFFALAQCEDEIVFFDSAGQLYKTKTITDPYHSMMVECEIHPIGEPFPNPPFLQSAHQTGTVFYLENVRKLMRYDLLAAMGPQTCHEFSADQRVLSMTATDEMVYLLIEEVDGTVKLYTCDRQGNLSVLGEPGLPGANLITGTTSRDVQENPHNFLYASDGKTIQELNPEDGMATGAAISVEAVLPGQTEIASFTLASAPKNYLGGVPCQYLYVATPTHKLYALYLYADPVRAAPIGMGRANIVATRRGLIFYPDNTVLPNALTRLNAVNDVEIFCPAAGPGQDLVLPNNYCNIYSLDLPQVRTTLSFSESLGQTDPLTMELGFTREISSCKCEAAPPFRYSDSLFTRGADGGLTPIAQVCNPNPKEIHDALRIVINRTDTGGWVIGTIDIDPIPVQY
ncbi:MAG: hypothetical protein AAGN35_15480 [Bacteroidota bacterium]